MPDTIRLDYSGSVNPDVVWDLRKYPYPFEANSFDLIECKDVIEHLEDIPRTLGECHRILKAHGILKITTPHFSCANSYVDPTHRYHLSFFSFDYFTGNHQLDYYLPAQFKMKFRQLIFDGNRLRRWALTRIANHWPRFYESRWAWIFPAWFLYFELEKPLNQTKDSKTPGAL